MEEQSFSIPVNNPIPEASYSGSFSHGWEIMKKYFIELLVVILLQILLSLPLGLGEAVMEEPSYGLTGYTLFTILYGLIVMAPVSYGSCWVFLKAVRGEQFKAYEIFYAFQNMKNVVLATILLYAIIGIGFVLLIVPGIIFACRLVFVPYLVIDRKMEAVEAIKESWEMSKGYGWTVCGMGIMSFFIVLAGVICLIVGIFPASIWISCAFATLYWTVSNKKQTFQV